VAVGNNIASKETLFQSDKYMRGGDIEEQENKKKNVYSEGVSSSRAIGKHLNSHKSVFVP
jgi:hypothetical protein